MPKDKPGTDTTALEAEVAAESDPIMEKTATWNDQEWTVPPTLDAWPVAAYLAMEQGKVMTQLSELLGRRQFARFVAGSRSTAADAAELSMEIFTQAYGVTPGE